jgi:Tfp pilus assembly protein PilX
MKKLLILLGVAGMLTQAEAQKMKSTNAPAAVTTAFNQAHSSVKKVEWKLKDGNNYAAEYKEGGVNMCATYDATGNLMETKMEIASSALPAPILSYVKQNYKEDEVKKSWKITDAGGTITYKAKVKDQHLLFDANGTFIKVIKSKA